MKAHEKLWNCGIAESEPKEWLFERTTTYQEFDELNSTTETILADEPLEVRGMYCMFAALLFSGTLEV